MKVTPKKTLLLGAAIAIIQVFGCNRSFHFSNKDLLLTKPFYKADTVIYISETGLLDTIIFFPRRSYRSNPMNFEQGFDDRYTLEVTYLLTSGSYHKFINAPGDSATLFFAYISPNSYSKKELYFLGLAFDEDSLNMIYSDTSKLIYFIKKNATSYDANINEGITSFIFDVNKGVLSYVDKNNLRWSPKR